jgi:hypothetical protein
MSWRTIPSIHISVGLGRSIARSVVAGDVGFWSGPEPEQGCPAVTMPSFLEDDPRIWRCT